MPSQPHVLLESTRSKQYHNSLVFLSTALSNAKRPVAVLAVPGWCELFQYQLGAILLHQVIFGGSNGTVLINVSLRKKILATKLPKFHVNLTLVHVRIGFRSCFYHSKVATSLHNLLLL